MGSEGLVTATPGSVKSDWQTAVSNSNATADTAAMLLAPTTSTAATRVPIPAGATRVLIRQRASATGVTVTTLATVIPIVVDRNGVPTRIDSATLGAAAITVPFDTTLASNYDGANMSGVVAPDGQAGADTSAFSYGVPTTLDGYDMQGGQWLYILRVVASALTGGAANPTIEVLFLN